MYICTFKYMPEDVNCQFCTFYIHRRCTANSGCPFLAERIASLWRIFCVFGGLGAMPSTSIFRVCHNTGIACR